MQLPGRGVSGVAGEGVVQKTYAAGQSRNQVHYTPLPHSKGCSVCGSILPASTNALAAALQPGNKRTLPRRMHAMRARMMQALLEAAMVALPPWRGLLLTCAHRAATLAWPHLYSPSRTARAITSSAPAPANCVAPEVVLQGLAGCKGMLGMAHCRQAPVAPSLHAPLKFTKVRVTIHEQHAW